MISIMIMALTLRHLNERASGNHQCSHGHSVEDSNQMHSAHENLPTSYPLPKNCCTSNYNIIIIMLSASGSLAVPKP